MFILSIDVATKSLAVSLVKINTFSTEYNTYLSNKEKLTSELNMVENILEKMDYLIKINKEFNNFLTYVQEQLPNKYELLYLEIKDLIPGKKLQDSTIIERTFKLNRYLNELSTKLKKITNIQDIKVLVEYQMGPNDKSRVISNQILYHFSSLVREENIILVKPALKNTIYIKEEGKYYNFIQKYSNNYTANKAHSKYNFLQWIKLTKNEKLIKNIKKKNIDDVADSFLMAVAWYLHNFN